MAKHRDDLLVLCRCGHELGRFIPADDHGSVLMVCPVCGKTVEIYNAALMEVMNNPEQYEPNDRITAND